MSAPGKVRRLNLRLHSSEKALIEAAAKSMHMTVSEFMRWSVQKRIAETLGDDADLNEAQR